MQTTFSLSTSLSSKVIRTFNQFAASEIQILSLSYFLLSTEKQETQKIL